VQVFPFSAQFEGWNVVTQVYPKSLTVCNGGGTRARMPRRMLQPDSRWPHQGAQKPIAYEEPVGMRTGARNTRRQGVNNADEYIGIAMPGELPARF